jgi:hypothetical protein
MRDLFVEANICGRPGAAGASDDDDWGGGNRGEKGAWRARAGGAPPARLRWGSRSHPGCWQRPRAPRGPAPRHALYTPTHLPGRASSQHPPRAAAVPHPRPRRPPAHPPARPACPAGACVFIVEETLRAEGGPSPCFIYRGALRSRAPGAAPGAARGAADRADRADRPSTLYVGHDPASPRPKRRRPAGPPPPPYRLALHGADGGVLHGGRAPSAALLIDAGARLAVWGPWALAFPAGAEGAAALAALAAGLRGVAARGARLGGHPAAALAAGAAPLAAAGCAPPPAWAPLEPAAAALLEGAAAEAAPPPPPLPSPRSVLWAADEGDKAVAAPAPARAAALATPGPRVVRAGARRALRLASALPPPAAAASPAAPSPACAARAHSFSSLCTLSRFPTN